MSNNTAHHSLSLKAIQEINNLQRKEVTSNVEGRKELQIEQLKSHARFLLYQKGLCTNLRLAIIQVAVCLMNIC